MPKFLILRFSSIGDIALTSPVIRIIKQQIKGAEVHFLIKSSFKQVLENNPYIDKLFTTDGTLTDVLEQLKAEKYDFVIDLHTNLRTLRVKQALKVKSFSFDKINFEKWMMVNLKINRLPAIHIVDRYLQTLSSFNVFNDLVGLDYFISESDIVELSEFPINFQNGFVAFVIGAKHATKTLPADKIVSITKKLNYPTILLGGKEDLQKGDQIQELIGQNCWNAAGKFKLNQSASILQQSKVVVTHDTGLMHIASAFNKPIVSIWGNTIPEFGMSPYLPQFPANSIIMEVKNLSCRPCSKIGYEICPKKHFNCMNMQNEDEIVNAVKQFLQ